MDADPVHIAAQGQLTMPDAAWEQARSRAAVIGSLAARGATGIATADRAAAELGVSRRQVYVFWAGTARVLVLSLIWRFAVQPVARVGTVCLSRLRKSFAT